MCSWTIHAAKELRRWWWHHLVVKEWWQTRFRARGNLVPSSAPSSAPTRPVLGDTSPEQQVLAPWVCSCAQVRCRGDRQTQQSQHRSSLFIKLTQISAVRLFWRIFFATNTKSVRAFSKPANDYFSSVGDEQNLGCIPARSTLGRASRCVNL